MWCYGGSLGSQKCMSHQSLEHCFSFFFFLPGRISELCGGIFFSFSFSFSSPLLWKVLVVTTGQTSMSFSVGADFCHEVFIEHNTCQVHIRRRRPMHGIHPLNETCSENLRLEMQLGRSAGCPAGLLLSCPKQSRNVNENRSLGTGLFTVSFSHAGNLAGGKWITWL